MTDTELLELAAKALGYEYIGNSCAQIKIINGRNFKFHWNPIDNNSDALKLAVKLKIDIQFVEAIHSMHLRDRVVTRIGDKTLLAEPMINEMTATRRLIVRAAAEIGKQLNP